MAAEAPAVPAVSGGPVPPATPAPGEVAPETSRAARVAGQPLGPPQATGLTHATSKAAPLRPPGDLGRDPNSERETQDEKVTAADSSPASAKKKKKKEKKKKEQDKQIAEREVAPEEHLTGSWSS